MSLLQGLHINYLSQKFLESSPAEERSITRSVVGMRLIRIFNRSQEQPALLVIRFSTHLPKYGKAVLSDFKDNIVQLTQPCYRTAFQLSGGAPAPDIMKLTIISQRPSAESD